MSELALEFRTRIGQKDMDEKHLVSCVFSSPESSDESTALYLRHETLPRAEINRLERILAGSRKPGQVILLKIVPLNHVWSVAARDGMTLAALAMYHGMRSNGWEL